MVNKETGLRVDLGCGSAKKVGTIGVDVQNIEGVDIVIDLENKPLPFKNGSVEYLHSSHFLEHMSDPVRIFAEISRVCADRAVLELWTPYGGSNSAFILGHKIFFTEDIYLHMCTWFVEFWRPILGARWVLNEFQYVIDPRTLCYLRSMNISLDFALRHLRNIADEFCAYITVRHGKEAEPIAPLRRTFSTDRFAPRYHIKKDNVAPSYVIRRGESTVEVTSKLVTEAVKSYAQGDALPPIAAV